jgi:raffinose/stachyose/melibiose transport system permease protein
VSAPSRGTVVKYTILTVLALGFVGLPLWTLIINSLKPLGEANELGTGLPHHWTAWDNYKTVIQDGHAVRGFLNSLIIAIPSVTIVLLVGSLAAWVFARGKSRALSVVYYFSIAGILLPPAVVTTVLVLKNAGVYGSYLGVVLFYSGVFMSFAIFFITGFVKSIPIELEEAARIEGSRPIGIFFRVILPLLRPILTSTLVVIMLFIWNDFFFPFFLIEDESKNTLTLGLYNFVSGYQYQVRWNLVFAEVVVVSLPMLLVYVVAQKRIVAGLMGGAINR